MIKNYYIFDDIISKENQEILYEYVKNQNIKWEFMENVTGYYGGKLSTHKFPAKVHPQNNCKDDKIKDLISDFQIRISEKINLEFVQNYRWKINWTQPISFEHNPMHLLHYDRINEHIAVVYYVNDSTGDTCLYTNVNGDNVQSFQENFNNVNYDSYSLLKRVSPKMGRCFVFDGRLAHHANYPLDGDRFIINFNFAAKSKSPKNLL